MSAGKDVLAVLAKLTRLAAVVRNIDGDELTRFKIEDARTAVEELIEAGKEYRDAEAAWADDSVGSRKVLTRLEIARDRFCEALAQVQA